VRGNQPEAALFTTELALAALTGSTGLNQNQNIYMTMPVEHLPLLEPLRLPFDFYTLGLVSNPFADAIEPALKILVNLGYTDVDQNNGYERTLDDPGTPTPFFTLPSNVDWNRVPGDVVNALIKGFTDQFGGGTPHPAPPVRVGDFVDFVSSLINLPGLIGSVLDPSSVSAVPNDNAQDLTASTLAAPVEKTAPTQTATESASATEPEAKGAVTPVKDGPKLNVITGTPDPSTGISGNGSTGSGNPITKVGSDIGTALTDATKHFGDAVTTGIKQVTGADAAEKTSSDTGASSSGSANSAGSGSDSGGGSSSGGGSGS
jgi:hypothetical protein